MTCELSRYLMGGRIHLGAYWTGANGKVSTSVHVTLKLTILQLRSCVIFVSIYLYRCWAND